MRGIVIAGLLVLAAGVLLVDHVRSQPPGPRDGGRPPRGERRDGDGPPGRGPHGEHRPPPPPIIQALDTDKDGVLSADEIKSASANLLKLDTDKDGALSHEETRPAPPPHDDGPPGAGPRGPGRGPGEGPRRGPRDEPRGDRDDDRGPGGPGDDRGPPPPPHGKRPELGHVLPPFVRDDINLTEEQQKQIADLESEVKEKLGKILTADQKAQCEKLMQRGPGGPPPRGPRGPEGRGEGPGDRDGDGDRPPRPRRPDGEGRPQGD